MKRSRIILIVFFFSTMLYAQGNYKQGYIITNRQDTIEGWINLQTDKKNQRQCEFKQDLKLDTKIYLPGDIVGYRFTDNGKYYVSREIQLDGAPQKVFLEFLLKGIMNLYYYEDAIVYYFFENQDGKMELISQTPEKIDARQLVLRKDNAYIGRIRYLFRDYQSIVQKADKLKFNQKSMMGIVEEYHNAVCTTGESCIIFQNEHPDDKGVKCEISVYGGLQLSNYTFKNMSGSIAQTESNLSPVLGVQANLMNPRLSNFFSIQADVSLSQFKGEIPDKVDRIYTIDDETSYESIAYSLLLGIKYTYPKYKISPTAEIGIAYTYLSYSRGEKVQTPFLKRQHYGYYLSVGANYRIQANHAIFIRLVYENYPFQDGALYSGTDKISMPNIKIGYTF